jgi:hypothetical protein
MTRRLARGIQGLPQKEDGLGLLTGPSGAARQAQLRDVRLLGQAELLDGVGSHGIAPEAVLLSLDATRAVVSRRGRKGSR